MNPNPKMPITETKRCSLCGTVKSFSEFHKDRTGANGLVARCKTCTAERNRNHYAANAKVRAGQSREYYAANRESARERQREYCINNRAAIAARNAAKAPTRAARKRKRYAANAETEAQRQREYRAANRATVADTHRNYRAANKEKTAAHDAANHAIKTGVLVRPSQCSVCSTDKGIIDAHHDSYAPEHRLVVRWLCRPCHRAHHRKYP
jgi:hypothetical protein